MPHAVWLAGREWELSLQWALLSEQGSHSPGLPISMWGSKGSSGPGHLPSAQWQVSGARTGVPLTTLSSETRVRGASSPSDQGLGASVESRCHPVLPVLVLSAWPKMQLGFEFWRLSCVVTFPMSWSHMALVSCG